MGSDLCQKIKEKAKEFKVALSVHAPYFVNLNSAEEGKRLSSQERLLRSARMAEKCGAKSVVFHCAYYGKSTPEQTYETVKKGLKDVLSILKSERNSVVLRPETMGKKSQFGSLEEILFLCRDLDGMLPCIDFCHIHAREGKANTYGEFYRILKKIEKKLGSAALKNMHIHISGVAYSDKGEIKHLILNESDFAEEIVYELKIIKNIKLIKLRGRISTFDISDLITNSQDLIFLVIASKAWQSHRIKCLLREIIENGGKSSTD
jgi:deoxyribonuclease-4